MEVPTLRQLPKSLGPLPQTSARTAPELPRSPSRIVQSEGWFSLVGSLFSNCYRNVHVIAGRSDVNFGEFGLPPRGGLWGASLSRTPALHFKQGVVSSWLGIAGYASESLGQQNGPKRDMWMTGFIVTRFRCESGGGLGGLAQLDIITECFFRGSAD